MLAQLGWSLLPLGHLHHPLLKLLIALFGMLHHVCGINFLYLVVNLILVSVPPFPTHLFLRPPLLPILIHQKPLCLSITPSLFHFRLKTYLFHKSSVVITSSPDYIHGPLPGPFLLSYSVFVLRFSLFFRFCAVR